MDYLFGVHSVGEWLRADPSRLTRLLVAPRPNERVEKLVTRAREAGIEIATIDPNRLRQLSHPRNPQGVGAEVAPFPFAELEDILADPESTQLLVVVDGVTDPGNLGAILRSAAFFGAAAVILPRDRSAAISPVVERSAAGAAARLPIVQVNSLLKCVEGLVRDGFRAVASIVGGHPAPWELDLTGPLVLMVGSEDKGLRPSLRRAAAIKTSLETQGPESLNVSAFGALLLYETARQRALSSP
ncbi:MAG: 23S rRNA (guanosine2251-2'-O)-methyltransferase [Myxococcota bacterium]|jgi:23S rRNA (guanosine2251-2'-O)-methyltransferase